MIKRCYDDDSDAYLILGKVKNVSERSLRQYVVGWRARQGQLLQEAHFFLDERSAHKKWRSIARQDSLPENRVITKDRQHMQVYEWEDDYLEFAKNEIDEKQARALIRKVSRDYKISAPKLEWGDFPGTSEYEYDENRIYFHHRDIISLLHELAHAIHSSRLDDRDIPYHSPGFVWTALELYNRYAGVDMNYLVYTAHKNGILGAFDTEPRCVTRLKHLKKPSKTAPGPE